MLGINTACGLLGMPDSRPNFDAFPYTAQSVLKSENQVTFNNKSEVIDYTFRVYREALDFNKGNSSGAILDTYAQLTFFCNINIFLSNKFQHDLQRYMYAQDTGTPPHKGDYGSTPKIWIDKHYIIKGIITTYQNRETKKRGRESKTNH